jgi:two-component system, chemotaxis family, protein-glutamate methylesterase/glutaminase
MAAPSIVVIGSSAGGLEALSKLAAQLPGDFPAPVFIVNHMAPETTGSALVRALERSGPLPCAWGRDGERFAGGRVYLAPPDNHMLLGPDRIKITKGARENRSRPAIDPLFRSAAVAFGSRAIGVVLTGYLDDGTAGLSAIQRCGGVCIVQDPLDAAYPDMPRNALAQVKVDHVVPVAQMGGILDRLARRASIERVRPPKDIVIEAKIAERVLSDLHSVEALGEQVPFNCPNCGGVLWRMSQPNHLRFRCHTGHSFTAPVLLAEQTAKIEETLWAALRMFEERRNLLHVMSARGSKGAAPGSTERAREAEVHIERIRAMLKFNHKPSRGGASARRGRIKSARAA